MFQTHARWGNNAHIGGCKQLTGLCFPHKHLVVEGRERDAEIENRQDKG